MVFGLAAQLSKDYTIRAMEVTVKKSNALDNSATRGLIKENSTAMDWWRDNFWIVLAVTIIVVSVGLGLILFCVCKSWVVAKPLKQNQRDEEKVYENVLNQSQIQLPPLPPRTFPSPEDAPPQKTPSQQLSTYSSVHKDRNKNTVSIPSYIEPEEDYDDVAIPTTIISQLPASQYEWDPGSPCVALGVTGIHKVWLST
ncbi:PREDICTED: SLP adapter and CSK-interacting membrane protein-like [Elephantulus edwardii]|uniref:SLP adapter and CSK-interacting membrane protein-like n=1 Tax=Elephantulus edwardii TaxID=28737 RepID=UPI0003F077FA|nr:PREDICTED: SLP adapter and CSK-interacting membrane protein-like [Elephantulus edwardii]